MQAFKRHCLDQDFTRWLTHAQWDTRQRYPFEDIRTSKFIPCTTRQAAALRAEALATLEQLGRDRKAIRAVKWNPDVYRRAIYDVRANARALLPFVGKLFEAARMDGLRLP